MRRAAVLAVMAILAVGLLAAGIYANEARKEVVVLCGNFSAGTSEADVIRQLDTGNLLRYRTEAMPSGSRIVVDSAFTLGLYTCTITLGEQGTVREARVS